MAEDRLLNACLHGGFAVQMLLWGGLFGCVLSVGLRGLKRRGWALNEVVWYLVPGALAVLALVTCGARLQHLEVTLQSTGARWVLSRMAHHASNIGEPLWVCGVMVVMVLACTAWLRAGSGRLFAAAVNAPMRSLSTLAWGVLTVGWLSGWDALVTALGGVCFWVLSASEGARGVRHAGAVVGVWTLGWTGWLSQWDALVLGSPVDDLAVLQSLPGGYVPWIIAAISVIVVALGWRGESEEGAWPVWRTGVACMAGVVVSLTAYPRTLPWAPVASLEGLSSRVALPVQEVNGVDLYGRVGGGCLREWTEEGWAEHTLPWVDGSNGMAGCRGQPRAIAVAAPADLPLAALPRWEGVTTILWVAEWAPGELPTGFDAWRYVTIPSRWARSGEVRRGPAPVRLSWTDEGWGVETPSGLTPIAGKAFRDWLPDINRGELILTFHPETPIGAVFDLCRAARHTKDALLGCTMERPGG